jgi:hypothetical protein
VHVSLRRLEIGVAREFLNRARGRTAHREMRTERVPQNVNPAVLETGAPCGMIDVIADVLLCQPFGMIFTDTTSPLLVDMGFPPRTAESLSSPTMGRVRRVDVHAGEQRMGTHGPWERMRH